MVSSSCLTSIALLALQQDEISMAAGEAFGAIALMDSLCEYLPDLTHLVVFSDSSVTV